MKAPLRNVLASIFVLLILGGTFFLGYRSGQKHIGSIDSLQTVSNKTVGEPQDVDFSIFWKTWNILNEKYVPTHSSTTPPTEEKVYGAIQGLTASFGDPYTVFFPPVQNDIFQSAVRGNFEGVGMEVGWLGWDK